MSRIGDLRNWDDIKGELFPDGLEKKDSPCLLIGNGASIAVSEKFDYESLYEEADLSVADRAIFDSFGTSNFEFVLRALSVAKLVNTHLEVEDEVIEERYDHIRAALIEIVGKIHIEGGQFYPNDDLKEEYLKYKSIYSTNYDLLLNWSLRDLGCYEWTKAVDMFFPDYCFNSLLECDDACTKVFYLHGALHLYREVNGDCKKLISREGDSLLDQIRRRDAAEIHFVSEGTSEQKRDAINESVYLKHVFDEFSCEKSDLIVFGFSFDEETDKHIVDVIKGCRGRRLAVSVYRGESTEDDLVAAMNLLRGKLGASCEELLFFDAATHPLGDNGSPFKNETVNVGG